MKRMLIIGYVAVALVGGMWLLTGCEEEVAHEKQVEVDNGEVTTTETTVRETPEGDIRVEKKVEERERDDGTVETETRTEEETLPAPQ